MRSATMLLLRNFSSENLNSRRNLLAAGGSGEDATNRSCVSIYRLDNVRICKCLWFSVNCQLSTSTYQGGVTLVASVLPSATAVKVEVKSQAYKIQQVKGQAVLVKVEKVNSQRAR